MPQLVDQRDQLAKAVGAVAIPDANLIVLRIEVLLRPRFPGAALAELKGGAVYAVVGAERGGQEEPRGECGTPAGLQVLRQDVWCVGPQVGPKKLADRRLRQLREGLRQIGRAGA